MQNQPENLAQQSKALQKVITFFERKNDLKPVNKILVENLVKDLKNLVPVINIIHEANEHFTEPPKNDFLALLMQYISMIKGEYEESAKAEIINKVFRMKDAKTVFNNTKQLLAHTPAAIGKFFIDFNKFNEIPTEALAGILLRETNTLKYGQKLAVRNFYGFSIETLKLDDTKDKNMQMWQAVREPIKNLLDDIDNKRIDLSDIPYLKYMNFDHLRNVDKAIEKLCNSTKLSNEEENALKKLDKYSHDVLDHQGPHSSAALEIAHIELAIKALQSCGNQKEYDALSEYIQFSNAKLTEEISKLEERLKPDLSECAREHYQRVLDVAKAVQIECEPSKVLEENSHLKLLNDTLKGIPKLSNREVWAISSNACKQLKKRGALSSLTALDVDKILEDGKFDDEKTKDNLKKILENMKSNAEQYNRTGLVAGISSALNSINDVVCAILLYTIKDLFCKKRNDKVVEKISNWAAILAEQKCQQTLPPIS